MTSRSVQRVMAIAAGVFLGIQSFAAGVELPPSAIPGLRYYYPPERIEPRMIEADICVYGGTSGGVAAAVQAGRMGKKTVLLVFGKHIGGLTAGGLTTTDGGEDDVAGGISREFYQRVGQWRWFTPSKAESVFKEMLQEAGVEVFYLCHLSRVNKNESEIQSVAMENGLTVEAARFIDATYEGDLMAMAGVSFTVGRESSRQYGESLNGVQAPGSGGRNFPPWVKISPYVIQDDASSGLLPRIRPGTALPEPGSADKSVQAYTFRMRLTKDAGRLPFPKPSFYDEMQYEILARLFHSEVADRFNPTPRWGLDTNNHGLFRGAYFINFVGGNHAWPEADYLTREKIFQEHANYQIGLMWFLVHSEKVPEQWRTEFSKWGLPADENQDTGGWSRELYIREGRRMVSDYVMTQHHCEGKAVAEDSVGLASYAMDSHHCNFYEINGWIRSEGNFAVHVPAYPVSYRAIIPKRAECTNLLVPWSLSATHVAFGSIRMEPVFMVLGQSAATAAVLSIDSRMPVQDVKYETLKARLLADGQFLNPPEDNRARLSSGEKAEEVN